MVVLDVHVWPHGVVDQETCVFAVENEMTAHRASGDNNMQKETCACSRVSVSIV